MSSTTDSEVFRFISLRQPQLSSTTDAPDAFFRYSIPGGIPDNNLYNRLIDALDLEDPRSEMITIAQAHLDGSELGTDATSLFEKHGAFQEILTWLNQHSSASWAEFQAEAETQLGTTLQAYTKSETYPSLKDGLWEQCIAFAVVGEDSAILETYVQVLRLLNLIEYQANEQLKGNEGFNLASRATMLLPGEIFPLPLRQTSTTEETTPDQPEDYSGALAEIDAALREISEAFAGQRALKRNQQYGNLPSSREALKDYVQTDDLLLNTDSQATISTSTRDLLAQLSLDFGRDRVPEMNSRLLLKQAEIAKLQAAANNQMSRGYTHVVIGTSVLEVPTDFQPKQQDQSENQTTDRPLPGVLGELKPLGCGDLLLMRQNLHKYEPGEIAHIENVLKTEKKDRTHRKLDRVEETVVTDNETINETERDTQTTERFSLEKEVQKVLESDLQVDAGVQVTANYGSAQVTANAGYASQLSQSEATNVATSYARDVSQRAVSRLVERVREQRSRTTITEVEETNFHGFDNTGGEGHVVGMYHWIDKLYEAYLVNYGKRLMFEFMIPEPAAFHIYNALAQPAEGQTLTKPAQPDSIGLNSADDITASNYISFAATYSAENVAPPPATYKWVNKAIREDKVDGKDNYVVVDNELEIPAGYTASIAFTKILPSHSSNDQIDIYVGQRWMSVDPYIVSGVLDDETGKIPVSIRSLNSGFALNIEVMATVTQEHLEQWRIDTFNAIIQAYKNQKSAYDSSVAAREIQAGFAIQGQNPSINRQIEKEELKRACISLLSAQRFDGFNSMEGGFDGADYPDFHFGAALSDGNFVKFFEQAFEWHNILYTFYPYFWGRKSNWTVVRNLSDPDTGFEQFLKAGFARVIVPVRPPFGKTVLYYLSTGQIWNGEDVPTLDNSLYVSIVEELRAAQDTVEQETQYGDPWIVKVPTTLVMLQSEIPPVLPDNS